MSRNETEQTPIPDPEVVPLANRRRFTAEYKSRVLDEADACTETGELGALLRREGMYSSYLSRWRCARQRAGCATLEKAAQQARFVEEGRFGLAKMNSGADKAPYRSDEMNHIAGLVIATVMNWRLLARHRSPLLNLGA
jgi:transposase